MADMQNGTRKIGCYGAYENTRVSRSAVALKEDMVRTLAQKYDVTHMNRNEYSLLLYDLRSAGVITTQEFSAGYGGTLPHASVPVEKSPETMPLGNNRADFAELLKQYAAAGLRPACEMILEEGHYQLFDFTEEMGFSMTLWDRMVGPCGPRNARGFTI